MDKSVRSKCFILESIKEIPDLNNKNWSEIIPDDINSPFYFSLLNQIQFFTSMNQYRIKNICSALKISTKTYYKILDEVDDE